MIAPPDFAIRAAVEAGRRSPCAKSQRGASVFDPRSGAILGAGYNSQPEPFVCAGSEACRASCSKLCVHAEQRAIRETAIRFGVIGFPARDLELVHAKVVDGQIVAGGGPSCWQCSREVLDVGLAAVWLYEEPRCTCHRAGAVHDDNCHIFPTHGQSGTWRRYTAEEFHRATAAHHGLPLEVRR